LKEQLEKLKNPELIEEPLVSGDSLKYAKKEGFLTKLGHIVKSWRRRWFSLKGNTLYYFSSPEVCHHDVMTNL
jgi:hypothetical protein